ncbi:MAG: TonB-dependent receptor [Dysgonamonadaceae bacterium]
MQIQQVNSQYIDDANTIINDGYFLNNLKATYRYFTKKSGTFSLFAGVNNVTNTHHSPMVNVNAIAIGNAEPRYYYPGMPRQAFMGLSWDF